MQVRSGRRRSDRSRRLLGQRIRLCPSDQPHQRCRRRPQPRICGDDRVANRSKPSGRRQPSTAVAQLAAIVTTLDCERRCVVDSAATGTSRVLPVIVVSMTVRVPSFSTLPPLRGREFWATVAESSVSVPRVEDCAAVVGEPIFDRDVSSVTVTPEVTLKHPIVPPPLMIRPGAAEPSITTSLVSRISLKG